MEADPKPITILHCPECKTYRVGIEGTKLGLFCESCGETEYFGAEVGYDSGFTCELAEAVIVHRVVSTFAEKVIDTSRDLYGSGVAHPSRLAGGAMHSLSIDALVLHQAVGSLCATGWAAAASLQLRAQLEILGNSAVIWNAEESMGYMAFKYSHSFLVETWNDSRRSDALRANAKEQLENGISKLPPEFRERATAFAFQNPLPRYWYQPEFRGPLQVINKYGADDIDQVYRELSSPAHGGYLGLRKFRDDPDDVHARPRQDPHSGSRAMNISSMLCLDQIHFRALVDGLPIEDSYRLLRDAIRHYGMKHPN